MEQTKQRIQEVNARIVGGHIQPLFSFHAELAIPADGATEQLYKRCTAPTPTDSKWLIGQPAESIWSETEGPYVKLHYTINRHEGASDGYMDDARLVLQGHWWYRGEVCIKPADKGSILHYRVYNIAPRRSRWMANAMWFSFRSQSKRVFSALLDIYK